MTWQPIETAPKDGRTIRYRRVIDGRIAFEGRAAWRAVTFPEISDPMIPEALRSSFTAAGWMSPASEADKRVPEPTHWQPVADGELQSGKDDGR